MEIILNKDQAMKAVDVSRNFAESASGLKVLRGVFLSAGFGRLRADDNGPVALVSGRARCPDAATGNGCCSGAESGNGVEERASESRGASQGGRRRGVRGGSFRSAPVRDRSGGVTRRSMHRRGACCRCR